MSVSIPVNNLETEESGLKMPENPASTSHINEPETSIFPVQCDAVGENQDTKSGDLESEDDDWYSDELYEEEYLDQSESVTKARSKNRGPNKWYKETNENFITYRKTCSKDQKERHINKQYKLDKATILLVEKLLDIKCFGAYHDVIGEGRNSIVIQAGRATSPRWTYLTFNTAVKIYKLTNNEEMNKAIFQRTQKEFQHIDWATYGPHPVRYCRNIILMQCIGTMDQPALTITTVPPNLLSIMYHAIIRSVTGAYAQGNGTVHGNLNPKKILFCDGIVHFVGWTHCLDGKHPNALKKLMRDCYFITKFFKRRGVHVKPIEDMFKEVTKLKEISKDVLDVIRVLNGRKRSTYQKLRGNSRFKFDENWLK